MPLGILDRSPPPFFRQGPSALTKLVLCSALSIFLMVADSRYKLTEPLRAALSTVLHPVQRSLLLPFNAWRSGQNYLAGLQQAQLAQAHLLQDMASLAERASRADQLINENAQLRALLDLRPAMTVRSQAAEILYEAPDIFSRKVIIDRGHSQSVVLGSPVINAEGVLGQVTRVYPLSAEVTLLTDKNAAIPVLNARTQIRGYAYGGEGRHGALALRFMATNADVQEGDPLNTSGIDGIYPPGLPVARIENIERKVDSGFASISLSPIAKIDGVRFVLVLQPLGLQLPPPPQPEPTTTTKSSGKSSANNLPSSIRGSP
ncbi:MAG: rod shape-determining protein MreC [Burkholderiales bacterium]